MMNVVQRFRVSNKNDSRWHDVYAERLWRLIPEAIRFRGRSSPCRDGVADEEEGCDGIDRTVTTTYSPSMVGTEQWGGGW